MTTNNHPAHGPVSLDRLHQISEILSKAAAQSDGGNLGYAMADAVKVIDGAIAAFGAKLDENGLLPCPLCGGGAEFDYDDDNLNWISCSACGISTDTVYHTDIDARDKLHEVWNRRTAMLQAGSHTEQNLDMVDHSGDANEKVEPVIKPYKLPFDQWLSQQNEPIDVDCGCVTTEAFYHWLRVAYEAGNSPVTPDGYVLVPKKLTAENGAKSVLSGEFSETKFINCPECFGDDDCETCDGSGRIEITVPVSWTNIKAIWAKGVEHFEAAPQQENV